MPLPTPHSANHISFPFYVPADHRAFRERSGEGLFSEKPPPQRNPNVSPLQRGETGAASLAEPSIECGAERERKRGKAGHVGNEADFPSDEQEAAAQTLEGLRRVKGELGLKTVLGVSNISFGLPARPLINQNFLTMAMAAGLDLPILNPNVDAMMAAVRCYHLLMNIDTDAREFIAAYGNATVSTSITSAAGMTAAPAAGEKRGLEEIVEAGLKGEAGEATRALLESRAPLDVVDNVLIPALDRVGAAFEAGKVFLPQLIQSAGAAQAAFEVIRERLSGQPGQGEDRGTIVLATVKGDIHDIGKNIVKVLLENYGYTVVDLGKDVDPAAVAEAVRKHRAPLVGLSALMTTTLKSMADTIALLHLEGLPCKIMVGGAVLTPEYASQIQADFYARDAKESVDIAKRVIG